LLTQLAEAILTEPDPALASIPGAIRLTDTRTLVREDVPRERDTEREAFLPGDLSDDDSDNGSEDGKGKARISSLEANGNGVMGNLGARISRIEVSPTTGPNEDISWEDDDIDDVSEQEAKPGGLSSKAGSILVCFSL
jgi:solute carrier family 45, member 1/2/4